MSVKNNIDLSRIMYRHDLVARPFESHGSCMLELLMYEKPKCCFSTKIHSPVL